MSLECVSNKDSDTISNFLHQCEVGRNLEETLNAGDLKCWDFIWVCETFLLVHFTYTFYSNDCIDAIFASENQCTQLKNFVLLSFSSSQQVCGEVAKSISLTILPGIIHLSKSLHCDILIAPNIVRSTWPLIMAYLSSEKWEAPRMTVTVSFLTFIKSWPCFQGWEKVPGPRFRSRFEVWCLFLL